MQAWTVFKDSTGRLHMAKSFCKAYGIKRSKVTTAEAVPKSRMHT